MDQRIQNKSTQTARKRSRRLLAGMAGFVLVLITATIFWFFLYSSMPRSDRYQAVFLDNGQVFFGKLKNVHGKYLRLEDAYYTKKQDLPANATAEQKAAVDANVSLVKVGDEVYGPENIIQIRAEQVLFWQNLTQDSKVSKAIDSTN